MTTKTLQTLLRRRGFYIIVGLLYDYPDGLTLKKLREELDTRKSHYNNYLRVKEMLLKIKLIMYFLDSDNKKCQTHETREGYVGEDERDS